MKLLVLVTTMHQDGCILYKRMNLHSNAVIANQDDCCGYKEEQIEGCQVKIVTTDSRGLSRNRNIALCHADQQSDLLMFSDDDLVFNDGYEEIIVSEFKQHPDADAIKFNIHDLSEHRKITMKRIEVFEKGTRRNMSSSGVVALVIKRETIVKHNLFFNEAFGAGTKNPSGEDTIFLMNIIDKKITLYRSPKDIAGIDQTASSWFHGYTDGYFQTAGRVLKETYPSIAHLLAVRSAFRFAKRENCKMGFVEILKNYLTGIRSK